MIKNKLNTKINCVTCAVAHICLARDLNKTEQAQLNELIKMVSIIKVGHHLYHQRQKMRYIFALHSGCCKEYCLDHQGNEKISNFYFPGDLIGLDSLPTELYSFSLIALKDSKLCMIPYEKFFQLLQEAPTLLRRFLHINSFKLQSQRDIPVVTNAKRRLAAFLLNIFYRAQQPQKLLLHMQLPMSQSDIGIFLGLAHETVNRILHFFHKDDVIQLTNKGICLTDFERLKAIAGVDKLHNKQAG